MTAGSVAPERTEHRVRGLDTLRFVLAGWVALSHATPLPFTDVLPRGVVRAVLDNLFNGAAAVTVFFVISGFCIHYPTRNATRVQLVPFYARRHIRILLPVLGSLAFARLVHTSVSGLTHAVYWSLVCEEVYYTLYPAILRLRAMLGWTALIAGAFASAYGVVLVVPNHGGYHEVGFGLTWIVGLPCWFLGCALAERVDGPRREVSAAAIWMWRAGAWILTSALSALHFHSAFRYAYSLNLFAIFAFFWLRDEIGHARSGGVSSFEKWGEFSYSLYLVHIPAFALFALMAGGFTTPRPLTWLAMLGFALFVGWLFFLLVERPAHRLARRVYRFIVARTTAASIATTPSVAG